RSSDLDQRDRGGGHDPFQPAPRAEHPLAGARDQPRGPCRAQGPEAGGAVVHRAVRLGQVDDRQHGREEAACRRQAHLPARRRQRAPRSQQGPGLYRSGPDREYPPGGRSGQADGRRRADRADRVHQPVPRGARAGPLDAVRRRVHRSLRRYAAGSRRKPGREGPLQEGAFGRAQELHRDRQPLRAAGEPGDPYRHVRHQPGAGRGTDRIPGPGRTGPQPVKVHGSLADAALDAELADAAGKVLLDLQAKGELEGKELGKEGDRAANAYLIERLRAERPGDGILSEESRDTLERLFKPRVWIIDPLDGTREYGEGRSDWAVHVGLAVDGEAQLGAVALPALGLVLRSDQPAQAAAHTGPPRMLVSRTRPAAEALAVAEKLGCELVPMGSAGA